ncbi:MAG: response regulator transcription factor [Acidobacteria bacterium]|nr:response regulator transcription factor [Acidobacteriota bacterium]
MSSSSEAISIVIADDHALVRESLRALLGNEPGITIVGDAGDGQQAVSVTTLLRPDILLLDMNMPRLNGIQVLRALEPLRLHTRVIMVVAAIEKSEILQALELGARGVIFKHSPSDVLLKSIQMIRAGQFWIGNEAVADLISHVRLMRRAPGSHMSRDSFGLTTRELEIVGAVAAGYSNKRNRG